MEAARTVALLRKMRHDFGNHLQVISGYLDMGRSELVKGYIAEIVQEMARDRMIFENLSPEAGLYFYEQVLMVRDLGVILIYRKIDLKSWPLGQVYQEPYLSISALPISINKETDPIVYVSLTEDDQGIEMILESDLLASPISRRLNRE